MDFCIRSILSIQAFASLPSFFKGRNHSSNLFLIINIFLAKLFDEPAFPVN